MNALKIKSIRPLRKDKVFDIQHNIEENNFLHAHPNLIVDDKIISNCGKHAGGLLIVPKAQESLPIIRVRGSDQSPITEGITAQHLKHFGLVKYDMLGLATLRIIHRCIDLILKAQENIENPTIDDVWNFYNKYLHPSIIDTKDQRVFEKVYIQGNFISTFQFAEKGVQTFCKRAEPHSIDDISAITALWRPGPLAGGADKKYLDYGGADENEHPILKEVLKNTRMLILYQEQFMQLAHKLAGFSLEDADKLRKLLVKPSHELGEQMKLERIEAGKKFIAGCLDVNMTEERANRLWFEEILPFCSYGFNSAHSYAYAYNSYHCAWLFTYFEEEWIKAALECDPDPQSVLASVRQYGYKIAKVDINYSNATEWVVKNKICYPPFVSIKGVGEVAAKEIIEDRTIEKKYKSLDHLFFKIDQGKKRWRFSKANKKVIENLIKMGSFESIDVSSCFDNYKHMHDFLMEHFDAIKRLRISFEDAKSNPVPDWTLQEKMQIQRELVGYYDKAMLIAKYKRKFDEFEIYGIDEVPDDQNKKKIWAVIESTEKKKTKTGKDYASITVSGATDKTYTFRAWDTNLDSTNVWKDGYVVVFSLDYNEDFGYNVSKTFKPFCLSR